MSIQVHVPPVVDEDHAYSLFLYHLVLARAYFEATELNLVARIRREQDVAGVDDEFRAAAIAFVEKIETGYEHD